MVNQNSAASIFTVEFKSGKNVSIKTVQMQNKLFKAGLKLTS